MALRVLPPVTPVALSAFRICDNYPLQLRLEFCAEDALLSVPLHHLTIAESINEEIPPPSDYTLKFHKQINERDW